VILKWHSSDRDISYRLSRCCFLFIGAPVTFCELCCFRIQFDIFFSSTDEGSRGTECSMVVAWLFIQTISIYEINISRSYARCPWWVYFYPVITCNCNFYFTCRPSSISKAIQTYSGKCEYSLELPDDSHLLFLICWAKTHYNWQSQYFYTTISDVQRYYLSGTGQLQNSI
jgi:hypothetical protein